MWQKENRHLQKAEHIGRLHFYNWVKIKPNLLERHWHPSKLMPHDLVTLQRAPSLKGLLPLITYGSTFQHMKLWGQYSNHSQSKAGNKRDGSNLQCFTLWESSLPVTLGGNSHEILHKAFLTVIALWSCTLCFRARSCIFPVCFVLKYTSN